MATNKWERTCFGPTGSVALVTTALGTASPEIDPISFVSPSDEFTLRFVRLERVSNMAAQVNADVQTQKLKQYSYRFCCLMMFNVTLVIFNGKNGDMSFGVSASTVGF